MTDLCQCPTCGRMHKNLGFGKPPVAIAGPSLLRPAEQLKPVPLVPLAERSRAASEPSASAALFAGKLVREVCELPDRTSPEDQPDMLLVTCQELEQLTQHYITDAETAAREAAILAERSRIEAELARLVALYYRREIGRMMHRAEHWAKNGKPLAVHYRVNAADIYYQVVALMERDPAKGWQPPFEAMREAIDKPEQEPGVYPPSVEISAYRSARYAVAQLDAAERSRLYDLTEAGLHKESAARIRALADQPPSVQPAEKIAQGLRSALTAAQLANAICALLPPSIPSRPLRNQIIAIIGPHVLPAPPAPETTDGK